MNDFKHLSVEELIQKAKDEKWVDFNLSHRDLHALPDSLFELRWLRSLDLWNNHIGDEGAKALANAPWPQLQYLNLEDNHIGAEGAKALAKSQHLAQLQSLNLWGNAIGDKGASALANVCWPQLQSVDLAWNKIGGKGLKALAQAKHLVQLQCLDLRYNYAIENEGKQEFLNSPYFVQTDLENIFKGQGKGFCVQCLSKEHVQHQSNYYVCNKCTTRWV